MQALISMLTVLVLSLGCGMSSITMLDKGGKPITFKQRIGGRGCIAVSTNKEGGIDVIVQQDGSSDWASIRAIPITAQTVVTTVLGSRGDESAGFEGPSDIQGCAGLFESESEPVEEDTEPLG